jgi:hypothetical protein
MEVGFDSQSTGRGIGQAKWDISMSPQHVSYPACRWSVSTRSEQYKQLRRRNDDISDAESPGAFQISELRLSPLTSRGYKEMPYRVNP